MDIIMRWAACWAAAALLGEGPPNCCMEGELEGEGVYEASDFTLALTGCPSSSFPLIPKTASIASSSVSKTTKKLPMSFLTSLTLRSEKRETTSDSVALGETSRRITVLRTGFSTVSEVETEREGFWEGWEEGGAAAAGGCNGVNHAPSALTLTTLLPLRDIAMNCTSVVIPAILGN